MKLSDGFVSIYRNKLGDLIFVGIAGLLFLLFSFTALLSPSSSLSLNIFSIVLLILGLLLLVKSIADYFGKTSRSFELLRFQKEGIEHYHDKAINPLSYHWSEISKIVVTKDFQLIKPVGTTYSRNMLLILLNKSYEDSLFEKVKYQREVSSDGNSYLIFQLRPSDLFKLYDSLLTRFGKFAEILNCRSATIDFKKATVILS